MFIPLGDDNSDRRIQPVVNYTLIGLNILVFIFLQGMGSNLPFTFSCICWATCSTFTSSATTSRT
jgi:membrane associated rhomboid family serine protease